MHFPAILFAALSAGAYALPSNNADIGGSLNSKSNPGTHDPAIGIFSNPDCNGTETQPTLSFPDLGCHAFDSTSDTVGINFGKGSNSSCGLNVYTDPNCGHFARKTLTGKDNQFKCFSMEANGGAWQSLAAAVCDDEQPQMEQFTVER